ncbi:MAG: GNAT family N-acetyltransferase [Candidatus Aenigmarchaeota archaeon]|nr:GNAT family N-acetyltransferase [Candidatus Aenigmarchaeota archaeon]
MKDIKRKEKVMLVAEYNGKVIGNCEVRKEKFSKSHVANFGILIKREFRGLGIWKRLMKLAIKEAKKKLKVEMIFLTVLHRIRLLIIFIRSWALKNSVL